MQSEDIHNQFSNSGKNVKNLKLNMIIEFINYCEKTNPDINKNIFL